MKKFILPIIGVIALTAFFSIFIVKEVNQAIVLQFGDPKRIILKPGFKIILFGSPNCKTIAWLTSLTIKIEKKAVTANATIIPAMIFPTFILICRFLFL